MSHQSGTNWNHVMHVVVCLLTMGFIFPNALTETSDARELAEKQVSVAKK
jgi:hypothetical protein